MLVHVSDPRKLHDLRSAFGEVECISMAVGDDTLVVVHPCAVDDDEARIELSFFLKAWKARRPGVEVTVLG